jgi:hypothetical protein
VANRKATEKDRQTNKAGEIVGLVKAHQTYTKVSLVESLARIASRRNCLHNSNDFREALARPDDVNDAQSVEHRHMIRLSHECEVRFEPVAPTKYCHFRKVYALCQPVDSSHLLSMTNMVHECICRDSF